MAEWFKAAGACLLSNSYTTTATTFLSQAGWRSLSKEQGVTSSSLVFAYPREVAQLVEHLYGEILSTSYNMTVIQLSAAGRIMPVLSARA